MKFVFVLFIILVLYMTTNRKSHFLSGPKMSAQDIIRIQLKDLQNNNSNNSGIRTAYFFASPANKKQTGPYKKFERMVYSEVYKHLIKSKSWKIKRTSIQKTDRTYSVLVEVVSSYDNQTYIYLFELSRQYDHQKQKPLYDRYSKMYLDNYWRTDSVQLLEGFQGLKNIYGESLQPCRKKKKSDDRGSWNEQGYCDETDGGVHQICVNVDKTDKFSKNTGQGDWSDTRQGKNHCMCLGAWSLYKAKQDQGTTKKTTNELQCDSIMDDAFDEKYVGNWNTWNGDELPNQIVNGINHLMNQCFHEGTPRQKKHLQKLYKNLTKNRKEFHNSDIWRQYS